MVEPGDLVDGHSGRTRVVPEDGWWFQTSWSGRERISDPGP